MHYESYNMAMEIVKKLASESAVVIFSVSSCCMCHAVKRLFRSLSVNPTVYELDHHPNGHLILNALQFLLLNQNSSSSDSRNPPSSSSSPPVPVVFIGGKLVGAMDLVMASHINGSLIPLLKEAGALWL